MARARHYNRKKPGRTWTAAERHAQSIKAKARLVAQPAPPPAVTGPSAANLLDEATRGWGTR